MRKQKNWLIGAGSVLLIVLLLAGYAAIAAEIGDKTDPLVSFSYISDELMPKINGMLDDAVKGKTDEFAGILEARSEQYKKDLEKIISDFRASFSGDLNDEAFINAVADAVIAKAGGSPSSPDGSSSVMVKVVVPAGKTLTGMIGTQILLRLGSATVQASGTPGLIDLTSGGELADGRALERNHLYFISVDGRGLKAGEEATVFVLGEYTIS